MAQYTALMIGDVVGDQGLLCLEEGLSSLRKQYDAEFVVVNGENAAGGFGMTEENFKRIVNAGADVVTSGNHIWEKRELWPFLDSEQGLLRPANYPQGVPGKGWIAVQKNGIHWVVLNLQGREGMTAIDCPFRVADTIIKDIETSLSGPFVILIDFHAESTQEKEALSLYLDGRIHALCGTHTHVQTADERILPAGTAYITDLGMTGVSDSVIGMDTALALERNRTQIPLKMELAAGPAVIQGVSVTFDITDSDNQSIKVLRVERLKTPV